MTLTEQLEKVDKKIDYFYKRGCNNEKLNEERRAILAQLIIENKL